MTDGYAGWMLAPALGLGAPSITRVQQDLDVPASLTGEVPSGLISGSLQAGHSAGIYRGQVAQLVEQRIENPRVDGSIPSLATTSNFLIFKSFLASPADYRGRFWPEIG